MSLPQALPSPARALLAATHATLSSLHEQGRLPEEQLRLLSSLLLKEGGASHSQEGDGIERPGGDPTSPAGWSNLPELAEKLIFGTESSESLDDDCETKGCERLVCRGWRRAIARHSRAVRVSPRLRHAASYWATHIPGVFPAVKDLTLDLGLCASLDCTAGTGAGAIAAAMPSLERLRLERWWVSLEDLEAIAGHLTVLRQLSLSMNAIPLPYRIPDVDRALAALGKITSLEALDLELMAIVSGSDSWKPLGSLRRLRELHVRFDCSSIAGALPVLTPKLTLLTSLTLSMEMTPEALRGMAALPNLQTLDMLSPTLLLAVIPDLAKLKSLRRVQTGGNRHGGGKMRTAPTQGDLPTGPIQAPLIEQLHLQSVELMGASCTLDLAEALPGLVELTMHGGSIADASLTDLSRLQALTKLEFLHTFLGRPIVVPGLQGMPHLKELSINDIGLDNLETQNLPALLPRSLEKISLAFWDDIPFGFQELAKALAPLVLLRDLSLEGIFVTSQASPAMLMTKDETLAALRAALPHLENISLVM